ncbi:MAG: hypothetical protein AB7V43_19430, partial [Acidimicrobiia bacterium]
RARDRGGVEGGQLLGSFERRPLRLHHAALDGVRVYLYLRQACLSWRHPYPPAASSNQTLPFTKTMQTFMHAYTSSCVQTRSNASVTSA